MPETPASKLLDIAIEIAKRAPARQNTNVWGSIVSWKLIHQLRDQLDELGIEWRPDA